MTKSDHSLYKALWPNVSWLSSGLLIVGLALYTINERIFVDVIH